MKPETPYIDAATLLLRAQNNDFALGDIQVRREKMEVDTLLNDGAIEHTKDFLAETRDWTFEYVEDVNSDRAEEGHVKRLHFTREL
jgi:hypothetical protein